MTPSLGAIVESALFAFLCMMLTAVVMGIRLIYRIADRGARQALRSARSASRSLFGPGGSPEQIAQRLRERNPSLTRGPGDGTGLAFTCAGYRGRLDFISDLTEIRFALDGRTAATLEVSTPSFITRLAEDDVDAFRVRGSDARYKEVFRDPALGAMLRDWGVTFEWILRPAECVLRLRALPRNEEELWRWLKGSFALLHAALGLEAGAAVQVVKVSAEVLAGSLCQVCGASLGQDTVVYCIRCSTPHHEVCWTYAGECSTFACRERRSVR